MVDHTETQRYYKYYRAVDKTLLLHTCLEVRQLYKKKDNTVLWLLAYTYWQVT